ncbi:hypothetical protein IHN63_01595 [Deinococcus sp. 6YEL10]|uniref:hypothetical protein n=1 Tax=Deinococcus sp. 6YEL10 TaxID=2745870 RepID=UPI001E396F3C|nr:hypothetical protein [Deinococcus sp. 6YEL10]MCD0159992.1 hypothetical protein [Deinococcus sp. 6YEL10]
MTTLFAADDPIPASQPVTQLAVTLSGLFRASRSDGKQRTHVLSRGLQVRVGTADGDVIYLSRKGGEASPDETRAIADAAGWILFDTELSSWNGARYLIVRPAEPIDEDPPPVQPGAPPGSSPDSRDEESEKTLDERIRAALLGPGPWWNPTFTGGMRQSRLAALRGMKRTDLRDEELWIRRNWPVQAEDALAGGTVA